MALPYEGLAARPIGSTAPAAGPTDADEAPPVDDAEREAKLDVADRLISATKSGDRESVAAAFEDMHRIFSASKAAS